MARTPAERSARRRGRRRTRMCGSPAFSMRGNFAVTEMQPEFARDPLTLVALSSSVRSSTSTTATLRASSPPGRPGVLQTKWLR